MRVPRITPKIKQQIAFAHEQISNLEQKRKDINDKIATIKNDMEAIGIDRATFMYQRRVIAHNETKRASIDLSSKLVRDALVRIRDRIIQLL